MFITVDYVSVPMQLIDSVNYVMKNTFITTKALHVDIGRYL